MRALMLFAAFFIATPSMADEKIDQQLEVCIESGKTTADFLRCFNIADKAIDDQLNVIWGKLKSTADKTTSQEVLAAQRLWLKFRDKACPSYAEYGSMGRTFERQCRYDVVRHRVEELTKIYDFVSF